MRSLRVQRVLARPADETDLVDVREMRLTIETEHRQLRTHLQRAKFLLLAR